ncbi:MAG: asparagine synthase [Methanomicrobiaceae archaeon]|nr:asparagine synthase [Methanomicrobiaceae archaeon]
MEINGKILSEKEIEEILCKNPEKISECGGEFLLTWNDCIARDHFGIIPGDCPPGKMLCSGIETETISPDPDTESLEIAIEKAVKLRSSNGVVAFSGGVDSALIAKIAKRPCVTVGLKGSHDLNHAKEVALSLGLQETHFVEIPASDIKKALKSVIPLLPLKTPVEASIATTIFFITRWAHENGYEKIIAGQGADELFGGYARYLDTESIEDTLKSDFESLERQGRRDQAVAEKNGTYISCPYLDVRVVRAAKALPPESMVTDGIRKYPLRKVASMHMNEDFAFYGKKAMQYGSGIMKEIQKLARDNGYKNSVQRYIDHLV